MRKVSKARNAESDKKSFVKFLIIVAASAAGGFLLANVLLSNNVPEMVKGLWTLVPVLAKVIPALTVGLNIIFFVVCFIIYRKAKGLAIFAEEDDYKYEETDRLLSYVILITNVALITNLALFSANTRLAMEEELLSFELQMGLLGVGLVMLVVSLIMVIAFSNGSVKMVKKLNPEKRGSVFDYNFNKKWEQSCDEAQKLMIYKAAYKAFSVGNVACMILWLIAFLGQMFFGTGYLPVFMICLLYLILIGTYCLESIKLEHGRKEK